MKLRIFSMLLVLLLLLTACGSTDSNSTAPTAADTESTQPTESVPDTNEPVQPGAQVYRLEANGLNFRFELTDETNACLIGGTEAELPESFMAELGLEGTATMLLVTKYTGTYTVENDVYTITFNKAYKSFVYEYSDEQAIRDAMLKYFQDYASPSMLEEYEPMLRGEYVEITDENTEGIKAIFRLNGGLISYLEVYESADELSCVIECYDNGNTKRFCTYYDGNLDEVYEYREDGTPVLHTEYNSDGTCYSKTEFNERGHETRTAYYNPDGSEAGYSYNEYTYYDNGEIKSYTSYDTEGIITDAGEFHENGKEKSRSYYYYDNGQVTHYQEYDIHGEMVLILHYSYEGEIQEEIRYEHTYSDAGIKTGTKEYHQNDFLFQETTYHENGKRKLVLQYHENGNLYCREECNEQGQPLKMLYYHYEGGTEPYTELVYEYYDNGNQKIRREYNNGILAGEDEYFERSGNHKSSKRYYQNGQVSEYREYKDADWFEVCILTIQYDTEGNVTYYDRVEWEYYEDGTIKCQKNYYENGTVRYEINYSEDGRETGSIMYDENGAIIMTEVREYELYADGSTKTERLYRDGVLIQEDLYYEEGGLYIRRRFRDDSGTLYYYCEWDEYGSVKLEIEYDEFGNELYRYEP